jgi:hypothetical protein
MQLLAISRFSNSKDDHRNMMLGLLQFFEYIIAETKDIEIGYLGE